MKSFPYEIPEKYLNGYRIVGEPPRIKVRHEEGQAVSIEFWPDYAPAINWHIVIREIKEEVSQLWKDARDGVDITPGDGCPHSDNMIID